ncbi:hypothetical protein [Streptomyces albidoflavus]|uniref:hypothetical protein n=1 Tax=Streptomyces albidoflavus TaxID=1886 RepID=UPI004057C337
MPNIILPASLDDENEQTRAVYARYGAATYAASLLEVEFIHILATIEQQKADSAGRTLREDPWKKRYANGTMGVFLDALRGKRLLDAHPGLAEGLDTALDARNHLAHQYWWDEIGDADSRTGRSNMLCYLEQQRADFDRLTCQIRQNITLPLNPPARVRRQLPAEDAQTREMYALFGAAVYFANCIEVGLINILAIADVKHAKALQVRIDDPWDRRFADKKLTMGKLFSDVERGGHLAGRPGLAADLESAVNSRNELAHHFWVPRIEDSLTEAGRHRLIKDLEHRREAFEIANNSMDTLVIAPLMESMHISQEQRDHFEQGMQFRNQHKYGD